MLSIISPLTSGNKTVDVVKPEVEIQTIFMFFFLNCSLLSPVIVQNSLLGKFNGKDIKPFLKVAKTVSNSQVLNGYIHCWRESLEIYMID